MQLKESKSGQVYRVLRKLKRYYKIWYNLTINSFMSAMSTRFGSFIFLLGKSLRFILFLIFLLTLFAGTKGLGNYTPAQAIFFYLTFNVIDTITQLFYREVYRFRPLVVTGDFDLILVKPINPLFRALAGGADPLDLIMLVPYILALIYSGYMARDGVNIMSIFIYLLFLFNGFMIATGFHILVLALAILTTEIDHAIMIYRDLMSMGRIPVDIYREPLRSLITFVIPVGLMMTVPAKAFLGLLNPASFILTLSVSGIFLFLSYRVWIFSLSKYTSASS